MIALAPVERINLVLATAVTALAGLGWGARGMLAAGVGGLLAVANLRAVLVLAARSAREAAGGDLGAAARLSTALVLKMVLLFTLCAFALGALELMLLPFALGVWVIVPSFLAYGLWTAMKMKEETASP
jgi:hypothetical protein